MSTKYVNVMTPLLWKCNKDGHEWSARYGSIKHQDSWCPKCAKSLVLTIGICRDLALVMGGVCLSEVYKNANTPLLWKCDKDGHEWKSTYGNVYRGQWCQRCAGTIRKSITECRSLAAANAGFCLSDVYENAHKSMLWKCKYGHEWEAPYHYIQRGSWCPHCKQKTQRKIFDTITVIHPDFIWESSILKTRQKLDMYSPSLSAAIEYDGEQHFIPKEHWGGDEALVKNQAADLKKNARCSELGILLIRIHYADYRADPEGTISKVLQTLAIRQETTNERLIPK